MYGFFKECTSYKKEYRRDAERSREGREEDQEGAKGLTYFEILSNILRYYPNKTILEIKRLTLADVEVLMQAARLRRVDQENEIHMQAWANQAIQATKKQGKNKYVSIYRNYKDFYDYEKHIEEAWNGEKKEENNNNEFFELMRKANARR